MKLFDSHFHFEFGGESPSEYVVSSRAAGVEYLLAAGADYNESLVSQKFAEQADNAWFAAGIHPHNAASFSRISDFNVFIGNPKLAAIGEIGLDYFYMNSDRDTQMKVFGEFLEFSLGNKLPAVVHCRDKDGCFAAYEDAYSLLSGFSKSGGSFILHCFTGDLRWAEKYLEAGAYFGMSGIITFPAAKSLRDTFMEIPVDRILVETDSPYLAPVPHRGRKNRSEYLLETAKFAAALRNMELGKFAEITTGNAMKFFRLGQLADSADCRERQE